MKKTTRLKTSRTTQPTKDQSKQLAALDAIRDGDIDLTDIPEQGGRTGDARDFDMPPGLGKLATGPLR